MRKSKVIILCKNLITVPPGYRGKFVSKELYINYIACNFNGKKCFSEIPWSKLTAGCLVVAVLKNRSLDNTARVITSPKELKEIEEDIRRKDFYVVSRDNLKGSVSIDCAEVMDNMFKVLSEKKQSLKDFLLEVDIAKESAMSGEIAV